MDSIEKRHLCPACGYDLGFPAWEGTSASDEICPCCGIQYGYDDNAGGDTSKRNLIYEEWKNNWIKQGMPWNSVGIKPPINWDPIQQMKRIEIKNNRQDMTLN